jgi:hypothetical protein
MCEDLAPLRKATERYSVGFDARLLEGPDALVAMKEASTLEHLAASIKARAALRVAETDVWKEEGDRTPGHHLARVGGTSVGTAADAITTARRLESLPDTAEATRRGELSAQQADLVADGASADPTAESHLLAKARKASLAELRGEVARIKAGADPDPEERRRRIHSRRHLRDYTDREGAWHMTVLNNPEVGAVIMATLRPLIDELFKKARADGRREPLEAYAADALTELASMFLNDDDDAEDDDDAANADEAAGNTGDAADRADLTHDPAPSGEEPSAPREDSPAPPRRAGSASAGAGSRPSSSAGSTSTPCSVATPSPAKPATSWASAPWPSPPSTTCSTRWTPSWPRW